MLPPTFLLYGEEQDNKEDDLTAEMLSIFRTYTPEQKKLLLSLMKGILPEE